MKIDPRLLVLPLLLTGCASSSQIPGSASDRSIVSVQTSPGAAGEQLELTREANITSAPLQADVNAAWAALPAVFEELEIPVTGVDGNARMLTSVQRVRRIGGKSPASFFRCPGPYGNVASSGDVYVSVRVQILPGSAGSGSLLRSQIDATARPTTSGGTVQCSSNGSLQKLIGDTMAKRLGEA